MLPPCSSSLVSSNHSYDETITIRHPRNDAAACVRCVAPVALALVFMPGLYSTAYRVTFPAFLCGCLEFVSTVCVFYFFCLSRRCPLLPTFLSVLFCLLSLLVSERFSGLIWFGSVYLVTTAGFVADQLM